RGAGLGTVGFEDLLWFAADIHHFGDRNLHAKRQFVLLDAGHRIWRAEFIRGDAVKIGERVETFAASVAIHSGWVVDEQNWVASRAALHALINAGQIPAAPHTFAGVRRFAARDEDHEARQILVDRAKTISSPGAERGVPEQLIASVHQQLGR